MSNKYIKKNLPNPTSVKDAVNTLYCQNNLKTSHKIKILNRNGTELRKVPFEEFTAGQINIIIIHLHTSSIDDNTSNKLTEKSKNLAVLTRNLYNFENSVI